MRISDWSSDVCSSDLPMSHFGVLVIGGNVEQQLAPYHEFECTGLNDQFVQDIDVTEELAARIVNGESLEDALDEYGLSDKIVDSEADVQKVGQEIGRAQV